MEEITCNIHNHSTYSDGHGTYSTILEAAAQANLDVIVVTDHNIWVKGLEGYYERQGKRVLVLTGEEVHNQNRDPQKSHMLVLGAEAEMALYAIDPQQLINAVNQKGGLSFLAHPDEEALRYFPDESITWQDWQVKNFTGLELWNWFSEIKSVSPTLSQFILNLISPEQIGTHPSPTTIDRWNRMLSEGKHISVIGGSDAHALPFKIGWMTKIIFPYLVHFTAVNNHILLPQKLSGDIEQDKKSIYSALAKGSSYISYDLPAPTRGFSFTISNDESIASLGDTLTIKRGATVQISLPSPAEIHLLKEGKRIYASQNNDRMAYPIVEPGAYRVECYRDYLGKKRGWIYSNPIYVVKEQLTDGSFK